MSVCFSLFFYLFFKKVIETHTAYQLLFFKTHYLQRSRITHDETDVKDIISLLQDSWLNPFNPDLQDLVCPSTGKVASSEEEDDLLRAKEVGGGAYKAFREQCLEYDPPNPRHQEESQAQDHY